MASLTGAFSLNPVSFTRAIRGVRLVKLLLDCIHVSHLGPILVFLLISGWTQEISLWLLLVAEDGLGKLVWLV